MRKWQECSNIYYYRSAKVDMNRKFYWKELNKTENSTGKKPNEVWDYTQSPTVTLYKIPKPVLHWTYQLMVKRKPDRPHLIQRTDVVELQEMGQTWGLGLHETYHRVKMEKSFHLLFHPGWRGCWKVIGLVNWSVTQKKNFNNTNYGLKRYTKLTAYI